MDWTALTQIISSLGFPIAMCILIYRHDTQTIDELRKTVEANTLATQHLADIISKNGGADNG